MSKMTKMTLNDPADPNPEESRTHMIFEMERKLNAIWFKRRLASKDSYCNLSTSQYWDWLIFIDVMTKK
jgi:hypothetical protein